MPEAAVTPPRYIYTCSTGRCGQNYLSDFLKQHVPAAYVAFEEPHANVRLPGRLGSLERRFRRRFIETNELLGRGRVLQAFDNGDRSALEKYGRDRLAWIEHRLEKTGKRNFIEVSKHFAHGLHVPLTAANRNWGLMQLTRDPVSNMRSYLNRRKNFYFDNNRPSSGQSILRIEAESLSPGEHYLWAWFETELRFADLKEQFTPSHTFSLRTEQLNDPHVLGALLAAFGLDHTPIMLGPRKNTNVSLGFGETRVSAEDITAFERFLARVPAGLQKRIAYLKDYDPRSVHNMEPSG